MSRERINEEAVVQSLIRGDKAAKNQLLEAFRCGDVIFKPCVQKRLAAAIVENSTASDDAEDILSVYCHEHYLVSERCVCPEALEVLISALKRGNVRARVFLCEYIKKHYFDDASLSLLIGSLNIPSVKNVLMAYLEATQCSENFDQAGHTIFDDSRQRLINSVRRGDDDARELYLAYAYAQDKNRAFNKEELQCIDFMSKGFRGFKDVLSKSYSSMKGKLKLLELMREGSKEAYEVLLAQGIADIGDESETLAIDLLAEGCKGAKELLLQYIVKHHFREANFRKLQRIAAQGSSDATEILKKYKP